MKVLTAILLIISLSATAQITRKDIAPIALTFASGVFDGVAESLKWHYTAVDNRLSLNDQYWNPAISWTNKYKDGNPDLGPAFFGSTTFLVGATDGYHLMRTGRNITAMTAIALKFGDKQKWYWYVAEAIIYYLCYQIGFTLSYELF